MKTHYERIKEYVEKKKHVTTFEIAGKLHIPYASTRPIMEKLIKDGVIERNEKTQKYDFVQYGERQTSSEKAQARMSLLLDLLTEDEKDFLKDAIEGNTRRETAEKCARDEDFLPFADHFVEIGLFKPLGTGYTVALSEEDYLAFWDALSTEKKAEKPKHPDKIKLDEDLSDMKDDDDDGFRSLFREQKKWMEKRKNAYTTLFGEEKKSEEKPEDTSDPKDKEEPAVNDDKSEEELDYENRIREAFEDLPDDEVDITVANGRLTIQSSDKDASFMLYGTINDGYLLLHDGFETEKCFPNKEAAETALKNHTPEPVPYMYVGDKLLVTESIHGPMTWGMGTVLFFKAIKTLRASV